MIGSVVSPLRVAVVGSGPAGFYAAGHLLNATGSSVRVDLFDRLPTPWGLVRAGVAPDHPKIKSVSRVYEKIAHSAGFSFHGNVEVGTDVTHDQLVRAYHAVVYTVGTSAGNSLNIPGAELPGCHLATDFVAWYNGHPDHCSRHFDLSHERAVVIGNGNVALDVARMLALSPGELRTTDTADYALKALERSAVKEIVVLGRRGPLQAAYTVPELRELGELAAADITVDPQDIVLDETSQAFLESGTATLGDKKKLEVLSAFAARESADKARRIALRFLRSPDKIIGSERVEAVRVVRNELTSDLTARATHETETIDAGLVLCSIGYRGARILGVPFDERRGTIHNDRGRVTLEGTRQPIAGVYTAGWIKRGPSGVIGTNKKCAHETVDLLLDDLAAGRLPDPVESRDDLLSWIGRRSAIVSHAGWETIDRHERRLGEAQGRPRVKLVRRERLLECAASEQGDLGVEAPSDEGPGCRA